ncbi:MAG: prepilin-type N-terminal cleavage/methylation domain-containing protein [Candidatus Brocadiae bacterium]|nr:prepilin-type N-terminal cleavage/methylation domain-containing protein [Candidatus Brocadiia bacterium]
MLHRHGLTLVEVLLVVIVIAILAGMLLPTLTSHHGYGDRIIRCMSNLNQLAKGMASYLNELGSNCWYPYPLGRGRKADDFNGAEWLAALYWTGVIPDPGIYICPSSPDTNRNGEDLGTYRAPAAFGSQTVSYAGMHYRSLTDDTGAVVAGAITHDFPPNMPMACDDTQGVINHGSRGGHMSVIYFDSHVEGLTGQDIDVEKGVGQKPGLLWQLRN